MYRINFEKDLKELENFGYKKDTQGNYSKKVMKDTNKGWTYFETIEINKDDRIVRTRLYQDSADQEWVGYIEKTGRYIYDLEKAGLIEEVKNEKNGLVLHAERELEILLNQCEDEEAEELYYKLINIHTPDIEEIKNKAIAKSMVTMKKLYSQKELLELIEETRKLQDYTEKERNYILAHNTPSKIKEMLTYFWLTHTNDVFFNYFGFNWVPPMELQEKVRKKMNNINKTTIDIEIPFLKSLDAENVIVRNEMLNAANKLMYDYSMLPKELFNNNLMKGATNED